MAHNVSSTLQRAIYSAGTERVPIDLLEVIESPGNILRFTSNGESVIHNGETFIPLGFDIDPPSDQESVQPSVTITLPNVSVEIIAFFRSIITGSVDVKYMIVLDDDVNRIERGPWNLKLSDIDYDFSFVRGTLRVDSLLDEQFPVYTYNTLHYPGI